MTTDASVYQLLAARTLIEKPDFVITNEQLMLVWNSMGIAGEAGEVANLVKKGVFHQHGVDLEMIKGELGDVLWYAAAICTNLGLKLSDVLAANIEKLKARYPEGYSAEASRARGDFDSSMDPGDDEDG